jgi:hypothetical protein
MLFQRYAPYFAMLKGKRGPVLIKVTNVLVRA